MLPKVKSLNELGAKLSENPQLLQAFKDDPQSTLEQVKDKNPLTYDRWIYRGVVFALGLTIVLVVGGTLMMMSKSMVTIIDPTTHVSTMQFAEIKIPTILTALSSAAIGAIAGLLAPPPKNPKEQ